MDIRPTTRAAFEALRTAGGPQGPQAPCPAGQLVQPPGGGSALLQELAAGLPSLPDRLCPVGEERIEVLLTVTPGVRERPGADAAGVTGGYAPVPRCGAGAAEESS